MYRVVGFRKVSWPNLEVLLLYAVIRKGVAIVTTRQREDLVKFSVHASACLTKSTVRSPWVRKVIFGPLSAQP